MEKKMHVLISGKVQGVFFRANTKQKAENLGVKGWVRNTSDGKVEALFVGEENRIQEIIEWCKHGPPLANVENVDVKEREKEEDYSSFKIKY